MISAIGGLSFGCFRNSRGLSKSGKSNWYVVPLAMGGRSLYIS